MLGQVADAVNDAPDGHVINGSEMRVRDLMAELRTRASSGPCRCGWTPRSRVFPPPKGAATGRPKRNQGPVDPDGADGQRPGRDVPHAVARPGRGRGHAGGPAAGRGGVGGERGGAGVVLPGGDRRRQLRPRGREPGEGGAGAAERGDAASAGGERRARRCWPRRTSDGEEQLELDWRAADCKSPGRRRAQEVSRIYVSGDGVLVPVTTAAEKRKRRATVLRQRGADRRPGGVRRPSRPRLPAVDPGRTSGTSSSTWSRSTTRRRSGGWCR